MAASACLAFVSLKTLAWISSVGVLLHAVELTAIVYAMLVGSSGGDGSGGGGSTVGSSGSGAMVDAPGLWVGNQGWFGYFVSVGIISQSFMYATIVPSIYNAMTR